MADLPYDSTNGQNLVEGTKDFEAIDNAYDPASPSPFLMEARNLANFRDFCTYLRGLISDFVVQPVASLLFDPQSPAPTPEEGQLYYDDDAKCFTAVNDKTSSALCIGREFWVRCYNGTGSAITNGQIVYIDSASGVLPSVELAQANAFDTSRVLAVCTEASIANTTDGEFTKFGVVNDLDTSAYSAGDTLYLSPTVAGGWTSTKPTGSDFVIRVGTVIVSNATTGSVYVDPMITEFSADVNNITGWAEFGDQTLSFVDGTRTLTITPTGSEFVFYQSGTQYRKTTDSIVIPDSEGLHLVYYNEGTLASILNPSDSQVSAVIRTNPTVAYIYWDSTNSTGNYIGNELHQANNIGGMTTSSHAYHHFIDGARYSSGLGLTDIVTNQSGDADAHAQFGVASGVFVDEDLPFFPATIGSTVGLPIYYVGPSDVSRRTSEDGFSVLTDITAGVGSTGRLVYNDVSTGTLVTVASNDFVLCHVFGVNANATADQIIAVLGQAEYGSRGEAESGAETEIADIVLSGIVGPEAVRLATVIFQTGDGKSNAVKASIEETEDGSDYVDWRELRGISGSGSTGGGGTPGGADTNVQYNAAGIFSGDSTFTFDDVNKVVGAQDLTLTGDFNLGGQDADDILISTDGASTSDTALVTAGYVDANAGGGSSNTEQSIAYAASITPDLSSGNVVKVGSLTGNITVNNPSNATTAEEVYIRFTQDATGGRTVTLGSDYVLLDSNSNYPDGPNEVFFFSGITQSDGTIEGGFTPVESVGIDTYTYSANQTLTASQCYGSVIYVTGAATITLPAIASGMSVTVITIGAVAVSVDPNASDKIWLDGAALDDGDKITNGSTAGDIATLTYYSADGWHASSNSWTDGGA